jgi:hypothetical protein
MSNENKTIVSLTKALAKWLNLIKPTWSRKISSPERFKLVMNGEAVLDEETGLVWEKTPSTPSTQTWDWYHASLYCYQRVVSGRKGWRLPTIEELASLIDPTQTSAPYLPNGHPFINVTSAGGYWSATSMASDTSHALGMDFNTGDVSGYDKTASIYVWCVRGGYGYDAY